MPDTFDLIAIGGGTAGLVTAAGASYLGARVALVERHRLGGDCLWTGCVPSKALLASAHAAQVRRDSGRLGILGKARPVDLELVMASLRTAREAVSVHDDPARFRALGVEVVFGEATLLDARRVRVGDRVLEAPRLVLATGSVPSVPPIPGLAGAGYLTSDTIFDLTAAPASLGIVGGGPIGVELAQAFQRLGIPVELFEARETLLPGEDPEAGAIVRARLQAEGVTVRTGVTLERVERLDGISLVSWREASGTPGQSMHDTLLVATGRRSAVEGLGLDQAGVVLDEGNIRVDHRLRTNVPGIWAAGDVTGGPRFTHVADYQAKLVVRNALTPFPARADYRRVPRVTYTDPEVAAVGMSEAEVRAQGGQVWRQDLADLDRALTDRRTDGFVKLLASRRGRLLGGLVVGAAAGELITTVALALQQRLSLGDLTTLIYPYPTMSEGILRAANQSRRAALQGLGGRLLRRIVRWGL